MERIYMDHAATTPLHPAVWEIMSANMQMVYGNPSSIHAFGRESKAVVQQARDRIAQELGCSPQELIFTSGGSESDNTALFGAMWAAKQRMDKQGHSGMPHLITTAIEHHAVLHAAEHLQSLGFEVTIVQPDEYGMVSTTQIEQAIQPNTCLISVMYGNNEVGTLQPIEEIGLLARERSILMHSDAVQALGMIDIKLQELPLDLVSFSAHKINGPKGIGLLYARHGSAWQPLIYGGNQERKRRAGTENIAGIVGFCEALVQASQHREAKLQQIHQVRTLLLEGLQRELGERVVVNGHPDVRLPHILNVSFLDIPTEKLLMNLDMLGVMAASGSACTSGSLEVSHVLRAMQLSEERQQTAVRFSFGLGNTINEAQEVVTRIATIVHRIRSRQ
ncbi:cysteine desulfurase family protein [Paenibacillus taiwanensis]|uniref:cysteine desulfurase family protein n=1 Tax=Paenibacillus taiwanensis TaxID=401638 RepID=UPI000429D948|nr:cysteine desulfurase family protein [Paenibacillus taiwanensis]